MIQDAIALDPLIPTPNRSDKFESVRASTNTSIPVRAPRSRSRSDPPNECDNNKNCCTATSICRTLLGVFIVWFITVNLLATTTVYATPFVNEACKSAKFHCGLDICLEEVKHKCVNLECLLNKCISDDSCIEASKVCNNIVDEFLKYRWEEDSKLTNDDKVKRITYGYELYYPNNTVAGLSTVLYLIVGCVLFILLTIFCNPDV